MHDVHDDELLVHISDDNRRLDRVDRADPVIWLPDEALHILLAHRSDCECGIHLYNDHDEYPMLAGFIGCRFVLEPTHGDRIVYVIKDYDWSRNAWRAAWPD